MLPWKVRFASIQIPEHFLNMLYTSNKVKRVVEKKPVNIFKITPTNRVMQILVVFWVTELIISKFNKSALNVTVIVFIGKERWQSRKAIYEKFQSLKQVIAKSRICWYAITYVSTRMRSGTGINNDQLNVFIREKGEAFYNPDNQE